MCMFSFLTTCQKFFDVQLKFLFPFVLRRNSKMLILSAWFQIELLSYIFHIFHEIKYRFHNIYLSFDKFTFSETSVFMKEVDIFISAT